MTCEHQNLMPRRRIDQRALDCITPRRIGMHGGVVEHQ
jgi:hypothetical protein